MLGIKICWTTSLRSVNTFDEELLSPFLNPYLQQKFTPLSGSFYLRLLEMSNETYLISMVPMDDELISNSAICNWKKWPNDMRFHRFCKQSTTPTNCLVCSDTKFRGLRLRLWRRRPRLPGFGRINKNYPSIQKLGIHFFSSFLGIFYCSVGYKAESLRSSRRPISYNFGCTNVEAMSTCCTLQQKFIEL